ncbi:MAG: hypothetical protein JO295_10050 [Verrucomicrobia bacterium]|nr:hypothetical protein [Verrucomicrobiota bacterium]
MSDQEQVMIFENLDDDSVQWLENDVQRRDDYRDFLATLFDLLSPLASHPLPSYFDPSALSHQIANALPAFPSSHYLGQAARHNADTAIQLYDCAHEKGRCEAQVLNRFVVDLLKEFGRIRNIRSRESVAAK